VLKILQGSVVTQIVLGGLTSSGCKFPIVYTCQKYENWLAVDKVIAKPKRVPVFFLKHSVDV